MKGTSSYGGIEGRYDLVTRYGLLWFHYLPIGLAWNGKAADRSL
jgi:hypothetical protein